MTVTIVKKDGKMDSHYDVCEVFFSSDSLIVEKEVKLGGYRMEFYRISELLSWSVEDEGKMLPCEYSYSDNGWYRISHVKPPISRG